MGKLSMKSEVIEYKDGEVTCLGYVAYDETITTPRPGIVLYPDIFGIGNHVKNCANKLAELGYVALAADMFGGGQQPSTLDDGLKAMEGVVGDQAGWTSRAWAAVDALTAMPQVDASSTGAIGYCFGGSTVLLLAGQGRPLAGVVSFHGGLGNMPPFVKGSVTAKVLICTGAEDPLVPHDQVVAFEKDMAEAGADWQVICYGNAVHNFTNPEADGSISPAILYNEPAARRSWAAMKEFFGEIFA